MLVLTVAEQRGILPLQYLDDCLVVDLLPCFAGALLSLSIDLPRPEDCY